MTNFEPGDVVLVRFPFTDLSATKKRPALVVSPIDFTQRYHDVVLVALTSQPQPKPSFAMGDWRSAGLPKASWLKPLIATLSADLVVRRLGKLANADRPMVASLLRQLITPDFAK